MSRSTLKTACVRCERSDRSVRSDRSTQTHTSRRSLLVVCGIAAAVLLLASSCGKAPTGVSVSEPVPEKASFTPPPPNLGEVPVEEDALEFALKKTGLETLKFQGRSFLAGGDLQPFGHTPKFAGDANKELAAGRATSQTLDPATGTVTLQYPWGAVVAQYEKIQPNTLEIRVTVSNQTEQVMTAINLQVARLGYPEVPKASAIGLNPTPFKGGNFGATNSGQKPPVVLMDFADGVLLCGGKGEAVRTAGFWFAENEGKVNRAGLTLTDIPANASRTGTVVLRFGSAGLTVQELGADLLRAYVEAHPSTLNWPDRRPIGKIFLASSGNGPDQMDTNPNRWFMNAKDLDVTTDEGKEEFRGRVLKYAAGAVEALKVQNAQGGITWDPEGQRTGHTYYGDPRIIPDIAPEMEYTGEHELATIDAYFKVYDDAGFRHGICIRPQRVRKEGKYWVQDKLEDPDARFEQLDVKIDYAVKRWGSTLIYIDSDYNITAEQYRRLHEKYPQVLLIPEWEHPLHYAYTAPLQSLFHHGVTGTPPSIRALWPNAFCVNMVDNLLNVAPEVKEQVLQAAKAGDVLMVNAWYVNAPGKALGEMYAEDDKDAVTDGE